MKKNNTHNKEKPISQGTSAHKEDGIHGKAMLNVKRFITLYICAFHLACCYSLKIYLLVPGVGEIPDYGVHKKKFQVKFIWFPCNKPKVKRSIYDFFKCYATNDSKGMYKGMS